MNNEPYRLIEGEATSSFQMLELMEVAINKIARFDLCLVLNASMADIDYCCSLLCLRGLIHSTAIPFT